MSSAHAERRAVVEDDHRRRPRRAALTPNGMVGVVDEQMMFGLADEAEQVRHVAAAAALDVVGVDGPPGDRGDRVLELGRLVEPVGVERDGHVVRVGESRGRGRSARGRRRSPRGS